MNLMLVLSIMAPIFAVAFVVGIMATVFACMKRAGIPLKPGCCDCIPVDEEWRDRRLRRRARLQAHAINQFSTYQNVLQQEMARANPGTAASQMAGQMAAIGRMQQMIVNANPQQMAQQMAALQQMMGNANPQVVAQSTYAQSANADAQVVAPSANADIQVVAVSTPTTVSASVLPVVDVSTAVTGSKVQFCPSCGAERIAETQAFCASCGQNLSNIV